MKLLEKVSQRKVVLIVHLAQLIFVFSAYRLEPDPHHDGVIYGAAVGASQGLIPQRDFLSQYGPMQPLINGVWLKLFGTSMLNLRFFYCVLLVACSYLVYTSLRRYIKNDLSLLIPTAWILTGPFGLPWPSILGTFIVLVSIKFFEKSFLKKTTDRTANLFIFISGMAVGIGVFVRIHILIVFILATIMLFVFIKVNTIKSRFAVLWVTGFTTSITSVITFLHVTDSLRYYIYQSIVWPAKFYGKLDITKSYVVNWFWYPATFGIIITIVYLVKIYLEKSESKFRLLKSIVICSALFISSYLVSLQDKTGDLTLRNPKVLVITFADRLIHSVGYTAATLVILLALSIIFKSKSFFFNPIDPLKWLYLVYGLGIFGQLYPLYDNYHLWMISPIFLLSISILSPIMRNEYSHLAIKSFLVSLILALCIQQVGQLQIPRYSYKSDQLFGMQSNWVSARGTDLTLLELQESERKIKFNCGDGLYAVANGKYQAQDRKFYNWDPVLKMESTSTEYVFFCHSTRTKYSNYLKAGWGKVFEIPISIYFEGTTKVYWNVLLKNSKFFP